MNIRTGTLTEIDALQVKNLFLDHALNEWNSVNEASIDYQLGLVKRQLAEAVLVEDPSLVGTAFVLYGKACPNTLGKYHNLDRIAFIKDVVIHSNYQGRGLGTQMITRCIELAAKKNYEKVFIERHEQNRASKGMMIKAGFQTVATFHDPNKRLSGSQRTTLSSIAIPPTASVSK